MYKKVQLRWIKDLLSGIPQQKGKLRTLNRRCCLGVLNDIYREEKGIDNQVSLSESHMPVKKVLDWAGITNVQAHYLAYMNDSGSTFKQIAKRIESYKGV